MLPSHDRFLVEQRIADMRRAADAERLARRARHHDAATHAVAAVTGVAGRAHPHNDQTVPASPPSIPTPRRDDRRPSTAP
jgi:hypothetical protein